eukprot:4439134-Prymnesium_polylepis.1
MPRTTPHALVSQTAVNSGSPTHKSFMSRLAVRPGPVFQGSPPLMKSESFRRRDCQMWEDVAPSPTRTSTPANQSAIDRARGGKTRSEMDSWVD